MTRPGNIAKCDYADGSEVITATYRREMNPFGTLRETEAALELVRQFPSKFHPVSAVGAETSGSDVTQARLPLSGKLKEGLIIPALAGA